MLTCKLAFYSLMIFQIFTGEYSNYIINMQRRDTMAEIKIGTKKKKKGF